MHNISQQALLSVLVPIATCTQQREDLERLSAGEELIHGSGHVVDRAKQRSLFLRQALLAAAFRGDLTRDFREGR
jgi:hypothetical protein